jgi:hypothetical protein
MPLPRAKTATPPEHLPSLDYPVRYRLGQILTPDSRSSAPTLRTGDFLHGQARENGQIIEPLWPALLSSRWMWPRGALRPSVCADSNRGLDLHILLQTEGKKIEFAGGFDFQG